MTKYLGACTCRTITETCGSLMKAVRFRWISAASSAAVAPSAVTSWRRGIEIFPSGRTTRSSVRSLFSHTETLITSSGPILYWGPDSGGSTLAAATPPFDGASGGETVVGWTASSTIGVSLSGGASGFTVCLFEHPVASRTASRQATAHVAFTIPPPRTTDLTCIKTNFSFCYDKILLIPKRFLHVQSAILDLVEEGLVADVKDLGRLPPVPSGLSEDLLDEFLFGDSLRNLRHFFQRRLPGVVHGV